MNRIRVTQQSAGCDIAAGGIGWRNPAVTWSASHCLLTGHCLSDIERNDQAKKVMIEGREEKGEREADSKPEASRRNVQTI